MMNQNTLKKRAIALMGALLFAALLTACTAGNPASSGNAVRAFSTAGNAQRTTSGNAVRASSGNAAKASAPDDTLFLDVEPPVPLDVLYLARPVFEAMDSLAIAEGYLYDIDGDGTKEILTRSGTCEADAMLALYRAEADGAVPLATLPGSHIVLYADVRGGLIVQFAHMGQEQVDRITLDATGIATNALIPMHETNEYTTSDDWLLLEPEAWNENG